MHDERITDLGMDGDSILTGEKDGMAAFFYEREREPFAMIGIEECRDDEGRLESRDIVVEADGDEVLRIPCYSPLIYSALARGLGLTVDPALGIVGPHSG